ncbi:hypothetical protein [Sphingopyxis sp. BSNA05]|uniref:hypothetical protein n=1 Tax=Sphingopyxis sp. BSNA05 TaxID=1236614 RepID=UPI0020B74C62|nr:hypothetical protein [Sphingopyxis sp. BSNA05]
MVEAEQDMLDPDDRIGRCDIGYDRGFARTATGSSGVRRSVCMALLIGAMRTSASVVDSSSPFRPMLSPCSDPSQCSESRVRILLPANSRWGSASALQLAGRMTSPLWPRRELAEAFHSSDH